MPQRKSRTGRNAHASVARLQQRARAGGNWDRSSLPPATACIAGGRCDQEPMPACPVPLCAHHVREVYQYAQHVIEERLLPTVAALLDEQRALGEEATLPRPGTAHQRGYGHAHRKRVAELKRDMIDGQPCARGGEPLYLWQRELPAGHPLSLHGDHVETPRALGGALPDALSCAHHNTQHGARLGNRMRALGITPTHHARPSRRLAPPDPPTSRTW